MTKANTVIAAIAALAVLPSTVMAEGPSGYVRPIGDAPATVNPTPYTPALSCLAARGSSRQTPRISVGRIADLTGRVDLETGARVSQGAALFAITALGKAGVPVVERLDSSVADIELNYARQHLLSDTPERAGTDPENYRRIYAGQIAGSRYYIVGGITELNYNLASSGLNATAGEAGVGGVRGTASSTNYVMNVAVDLRLVDSRTQEVMDMASYQKQVKGREATLGLVGTVGDYGANIGGGRGAMEPLQAAVRTLVERGVFQLVANLQGPGATEQCLNPAANPSGPTLPSYAYLPNS
jgi:curli production assembly/transport component CsgG/holdfast attachment protein HfaB